MTHIIILISLFILEIIYFQLADKFNIIDKPNERSSHTDITLRGGGIIFFISAIMYFVKSGFQYPWFFGGLALMAVVSFLDDIFSLSNKIRLIVHFTAVLLMAYQLDIFHMPWYYLFISFVVIVGVINAYNFMDGINGITVCYSLSVGGLLMMTNQSIGFVAQDLIIYMMLGLIVFGFFNFRTKAKCFAGDVGSVCISFILLFALGALILKTNNFIYILFLAVYGIDTVWTIVHRLYLREDIFEAHRSHLYQYLANEAGINKLVVSVAYGGAQLLIGFAVIFFSTKDFITQWIFALLLLASLSIFYIKLRALIIKKFININSEHGNN